MNPHLQIIIWNICSNINENKNNNNDNNNNDNKNIENVDDCYICLR